MPRFITILSHMYLPKSNSCKREIDRGKVLTIVRTGEQLADGGGCRGLETALLQEMLTNDNDARQISSLYMD